MSSENTATAAVVMMGVSGAGKSTIGNMLAEIVPNSTFLDADDFHPHSNKEKMRAGIPLLDEDRIPWLNVLRDLLREQFHSGKTAILGCSALQKRYREILRSADPNYKPPGGDGTCNYAACLVKFVLLDADANTLAARLEKRAAEGNHFMPAKLLQSQLDLLEVDESEGVFKVDARLSPEVIVSTIQASALANQMTSFMRHSDESLMVRGCPTATPHNLKCLLRGYSGIMNFSW